MNPCDICVDEKCKGEYNCNCSSCEHKNSCNRFLFPTIRITTRCTQSCSHCCFECSPLSSDFMTIEKAKEIKRFLTSNEINTISLMGGEFFSHPRWKEIFSIIIPGMDYVRLVSNGDWAKNFGEDTAKELFKYKNVLKISISNDKWHTNKFVDNAIEYCKMFDLKYNIATEEQTTDDSIVPVGRSIFDSTNNYSFFSCYCQNPIHMYNFLIDENGDIFKCGFGIWNYANIEEYLDGGFNLRFKEFNRKFRSVFIGSCRVCIRGYHRS